MKLIKEFLMIGIIFGRVLEKVSNNKIQVELKIKLAKNKKNQPAQLAKVNHLHLLQLKIKLLLLSSLTLLHQPNQFNLLNQVNHRHLNQ
jgi:hypothetical protein